MINERPKTPSTIDRRMYEIACSFPALKRKGVVDGSIPGISPDERGVGVKSLILTNFDRLI